MAKKKAQEIRVMNVVGAAIVKDGKVLCCRRRHGLFAGKFEFPGGKIELGETRIQAISREIKEELNVDILVKNYIGTVTYDFPSHRINLSVYKCEIFYGEIDDREHLELRWVDRNEIDQLDWCPADQMIVNDVKNKA